MIIRLHLIFKTVIVLFASVYANGGPSKSSALMKGGDVKLENASEINLVREDLNFIVIDDSIKINVRYRLKNTSTEKKEITYAFPIDARINLFNREPELPSDININYDKLLLKYHLIQEKIDIDSVNEEYTIRRWLISSFTISGSSTEELTISYTIQSGFADDLDNTSYVPEYGERSMVWDFSPASYWGNGITDTMNITVDVHSIKMKGGSVELEGMEFVNNNGLYDFSKNSFDLKNKLTITYEYTTFLRNHGMMSKKVDVRNAVKVITSSHLNSKYSSEKLFDNDMSTAWVEGSSGFGSEDYIEITFIKPVTFTYMTMVPGYTKSKNTYQENNRIKKLPL
ncbi:MAG: hypothetical protein JW915_14505 [Chitinispirillaceae bacterium]|nr:hypothetical protein [Chitinispirillaceae bacterium]